MQAKENISYLYDKAQIVAVIPHRDPFILIDGIMAFESKKKCCSIRYVDPDDGVLGGHFPGKPIMPGVHIIENMAQTACFLLAKDDPDKTALYVLGKINNAVFCRMVCGGETIFTEVIVQRIFDGLAIVEATAKVQDTVCAKAELVVGIKK